MAEVAKMKNGIIKRGSTYSYCISVSDRATGKRKQRWVGGFPTHAAAKAAREDAVVAVRTGVYIAPDGRTLGEYLVTWVSTKDAAPKTLDGYAYQVNHYINPRIGALALRDVTPVALTAFYDDLRRGGSRDGGELGWPTIRAISRVLSSAFGDAVRLGLMLTNPASNATLPAKPTPTSHDVGQTENFRVFTPDELRKFINATDTSHRLGAFFHLAAYTGARRGELLHLRWGDIEFDTGQMFVRGSRGVVRGAAVDGPTKTRRRRTVSLDRGTVAALQAHRQAQVRDRLAAGPAWNDADDFVFRQVTGDPIWPETPTRLMKGLCNAAGVPRRRLHDLRHTHATILLNAGTPVHEVAARLGHASVHETLNTYAGVIRARQDAIGEDFAAALAVSSPAAGSGA